MALYRKKPVVIEAWEWPKNEVKEANISMIDSDNDWICTVCGHKAHEHGNCPTLEGYHIVCPGDMIIKGVKGEFYPCKPDIFKMTYDKVDENPCPCATCGQNSTSCCGCEKYFAWKKAKNNENMP